MTLKTIAKLAALGLGSAGVVLSVLDERARGQQAGPIEVVKAAPRSVLCNVTAYCACEVCCGSFARQGLPRATASGFKLQRGVHHKIAAAPKGWQFGTQLYVPGYGQCTVEDRGGAIKALPGQLPCVDLYFPTHAEARAWGRQTVEVTFVEN
jgi:3D (Asp-Asp-Asp) domain-containing protein